MVATGSIEYGANGLKGIVYRSGRSRERREIINPKGVEHGRRKNTAESVVKCVYLFIFVGFRLHGSWGLLRNG